MNKSLRKRLKRRERITLSIVILVLISLTLTIFNPLASQQTALSQENNVLYSHVNNTKITKITETPDSMILRYSWVTDGTTQEICNINTISIDFNSGDYESLNNKITLNDIQNQFGLKTSNITFTNANIQSATKQNIILTNKKATCNMVIIENRPYMSCDISANVNPTVSTFCVSGNVDGYLDIIILKNKGSGG